MTVSHRYRDFGTRPKQPQKPADQEHLELIEEQKLQSFEEGYRAGWDDAVKAEAEDSARLNGEFAQNLQDIGFTYHEAVTKLSTALDPILTSMVERVLPRISQGTLSFHIVDQLKEIAEQALGEPIKIVLSPANEEIINSLPSTYLPEQFALKPDVSLADDEVFIQLGILERQIDFEPVIDGVSKATEAFFHEIKEQGKDV